MTNRTVITSWRYDAWRRRERGVRSTDVADTQTTENIVFSHRTECARAHSWQIVLLSRYCLALNREWSFARNDRDGAPKVWLFGHSRGGAVSSYSLCLEQTKNVHTSCKVFGVKYIHNQRQALVFVGFAKYKARGRPIYCVKYKTRDLVFFEIRDFDSVQSTRYVRARDRRTATVSRTTDNYNNNNNNNTTRVYGLIDTRWGRRKTPRVPKRLPFSPINTDRDTLHTTLPRSVRVQTLFYPVAATRHTRVYCTCNIAWY